MDNKQKKPDYTNEEPFGLDFIIDLDDLSRRVHKAEIIFGAVAALIGAGITTIVVLAKKVKRG